MDKKINEKSFWTYKLEFYEVKCNDIRLDYDWDVAYYAFNYYVFFWFF